MKRLLLTVVCVSLLGVGVVSAQAKPAHDGRPKHEMKMHERLAEKLNLTEEQKTKAEEIRKRGREQMKPLMEEKKALHEKMNAVRKVNMEEFEKILTPEQKEKFAEMAKKKGPKHGKRMHKDKMKHLDEKPSEVEKK